MSRVSARVNDTASGGRFSSCTETSIGAGSGGGDSGGASGAAGRAGAGGGSGAGCARAESGTHAMLAATAIHRQVRSTKRSTAPRKVEEEARSCLDGRPLLEPWYERRAASALV